MDIFSHLLIGLLAASWASGFGPSFYVAVGALMSIVPDFDFLLFPLWKRFPFTWHHGISHTLAFPIVISALAYFALYKMTAISDTRLFLIMLLTGSLHIFCDLLGTGGVPLLYPLSKSYIKLNIDLGINSLLTLFSMSGVALLLVAYSGYVHLLDSESVTILLSSIFVIYYPCRAVIKFYREKRPENKGFIALPTINPLVWKFARRRETSEAIEITLKTGGAMRSYRIPKDRRETIERCEDLVYTYWHPEVQAEMRFFDFPCYNTVCQDGRMKIIWNSAEMGKFIEIEVVCEKGGVCVRKRFRRKYDSQIHP